MIVNGKALAKKTLQDLKTRLEKLKRSGVNPTLAIIALANDPFSLSFIRQKQKRAEALGIKVLIKKLPASSNRQRVGEVIRKCNLDPQIHGIVVQLPLPPALQENTEEIIQLVAPQKDVDGFLKNSLYTPAVALAVLKILTVIARNQVPPRTRLNLVKWLGDKKTLIIGRGPTAGRPIAQTFKKLGYPFSIAHSQTKNFLQVTKESDIIISCVGKAGLIRGEMLKKGAIAIDVGMSRNQEGKLVGDLDEASVSKVASFYTPTPGGTGPQTVAYLLENLVKATRKSSR